VGGLDCPDWILAEIAEFAKIVNLNIKKVINFNL
jgi:hypothetical protein